MVFQIKNVLSRIGKCNQSEDKKKDESEANHSSDHDQNFYLLPIPNY